LYEFLMGLLTIRIIRQPKWMINFIDNLLPLVNKLEIMFVKVTH